MTLNVVKNNNIKNYIQFFSLNKNNKFHIIKKNNLTFTLIMQIQNIKYKI